MSRPSVTLMGQCDGCGCTSRNACLDPFTDEPCEWANDDGTFCTTCAAIYGAACLGVPNSMIVFQRGAPPTVLPLMPSEAAMP